MPLSMIDLSINPSLYYSSVHPSICLFLPAKLFRRNCKLGRVFFCAVKCTETLCTHQHSPRFRSVTPKPLLFSSTAGSTSRPDLSEFHRRPGVERGGWAEERLYQQHAQGSGRVPPGHGEAADHSGRTLRGIQPGVWWGGVKPEGQSIRRPGATEPRWCSQQRRTADRKVPDCAVSMRHGDRRSFGGFWSSPQYSLKRLFKPTKGLYKQKVTTEEIDTPGLF